MELIVDIRKRLRDFYLNVNFIVKNEVLALLGGSGCGKSMTLKCIAGIETPDEGQIILNGRTLFDSEKRINLKPQKRHVGYLFQNYALFPNMTVAENILFSAVGSNDEKRDKLNKNIKRFQLSGLENSYPAQLSGGQQQRVAFARILSSNAELLLLDEPFSALDSYLKWQLELEMADLFHAYENSAVLVSHDRGEVFRLSDRVAVMSRGTIEAAGNKHELFSNPKTLAATLLTGCKNISKARLKDNNHIYAEEWNLQFTIPNSSFLIKYVGFRARFIEYRSTEGENTFLMEVVNVIEDTFSYLIMVRRKGTNAKLIRWEVDKKTWKSIQSPEIYLHFSPDKLMLLEK